jgi:hypothetical protein
VVAFDKRGAFEEILWQITAEAKLRKDGDVGAALLGLFRKAQNAAGVARKVADRRIELRKRYLHSLR